MGRHTTTTLLKKSHAQNLLVYTKGRKGLSKNGNTGFYPCVFSLQLKRFVYKVCCSFWYFWCCTRMYSRKAHSKILIMTSEKVILCSNVLFWFPHAPPPPLRHTSSPMTWNFVNHNKVLITLFELLYEF